MELLEKDLPIKQGDLYIKYDDKGTPEYAFKAKDMAGYFISIEKFYCLKKSMPETIVLPKLDAKKIDITSDDIHKRDLASYITGCVQIESWCFSGVKNATIVVPYNNSVRLGWQCFDTDANIKFVVPDNIGLFRVEENYTAGLYSEQFRWTILADERLKGPYNLFGKEYLVREHCSAAALGENFSVSHSLDSNEELEK